jgi:hypothetical protein
MDIFMVNLEYICHLSNDWGHIASDNEYLDDWKINWEEMAVAYLNGYIDAE